MGKLSLLMFAILILGCGTETPVVEEPVVEGPEPVVMQEEPIGHPLVAEGTVTHGEVNVDPKPSNRDGFRFLFKESYVSYRVAIREKDGEYLNSWGLTEVDRSNENDLLFIRFMGDPLDYDTEYEIELDVHNEDCERIEIVIQFRTKPRKPLVQETPTVMQEQPPVVPSGGHFRLDIDPMQIEAASVSHGQHDVDPEQLNANGIHVHFNMLIREYIIDLREANGASLGWSPHGLVKPENLVQHIKIMPAEGAPLLAFDTAYEIHIIVRDFGCSPSDFKIWFHTKPK